MLEKLLESIALFEEAKTEAEINVALRQIEVIDNDNRIIQVKKIRQTKQSIFHRNIMEE